MLAKPTEARAPTSSLSSTLYPTAIEVYLAPAHVDSDVGNSDAFCCSGATLERCVGKTLFVDALTGETVGQAARCITC